jgi:hypothetical protein
MVELTPLTRQEVKELHRQVAERVKAWVLSIIDLPEKELQAFPEARELQTQLQSRLWSLGWAQHQLGRRLDETLANEVFALLPEYDAQTATEDEKRAIFTEAIAKVEEAWVKTKLPLSVKHLRAHEKDRNQAAHDRYNRFFGRFRVDNFVEVVFASDRWGEYKNIALQVIQLVLGDTLDSNASYEDRDNLKRLIVAATEKAYPESPDGFSAFMDAIKVASQKFELPDNHPLKMPRRLFDVEERLYYWLPYSNPCMDEINALIAEVNESRAKDVSLLKKRVAGLLFFILYKDIGDKQTILNAMNTLLGVTLTEFTQEKIDFNKETLVAAIKAKYPDAPDALAAFLSALQENMGDTYPLAGYRLQPLAYPQIGYEDFINGTIPHDNQTLPIGKFIQDNSPGATQASLLKTFNNHPERQKTSVNTINAVPIFPNCGHVKHTAKAGAFPCLSSAVCPLVHT